MELCGKCGCGKSKDYSAIYCNACNLKMEKLIYERRIEHTTNKTVECVWETIAKELRAKSGDVSPEMVTKVEAVIMQAVKDYYEHNCK